MNEEARKGRKIVWIVIAALLVPSVIQLAFTRGTVRMDIIRFVIAFLMAFLLLRGYSWARSYLAFGLGLATLLTALNGFLGVLLFSWVALVLVLVPLYAWGAWTLWSSPYVEEYIRHCEQKRNPDMSFDTGS